MLSGVQASEKQRNMDIINLNVGGSYFSTSKQTLLTVPDTFFSALLLGQISTAHDSSGAIFIDRDPKLFSVILNFLRNNRLDLPNDIEPSCLLHEAEYYGIGPLVQQLRFLCLADEPVCGGVLFHGYIEPPPTERTNLTDKIASAFRLPSSGSTASNSPCHSRNSSLDIRLHLGMPVFRYAPTFLEHVAEGMLVGFKKTFMSVVVICQRIKNRYLSQSKPNLQLFDHFEHSNLYKTSGKSNMADGSKSWRSSHGHSRNSSYDSSILTGYMDTNASRMETSYNFTRLQFTVTSLKAHQNWVAACYTYFVVCYCLYEGVGWKKLVATSFSGRVGVWNSLTNQWQKQEISARIRCSDTANTVLILGCNGGRIFSIDMQKFPLRMKDNDLLLTELYRDPLEQTITAISVYQTSKTSTSGSWIEIAYGTGNGLLRVVVQHPETIGYGPRLFQTFAVHRSSIAKVMLSEKYLISVCSEYTHVRTWSITRFRGMISTQPGSTPLASYKIFSLRPIQPSVAYLKGNDIGPYGDKYDEQVFLYKFVPNASKLFVCYCSTGQQVCKIKSVDGSAITSYFVGECEATNKLNSRPQRYIYTGHSNGSIQLWDLNAAFLNEKISPVKNSPPVSELLKLLNQSDQGQVNGSLSSIPELRFG